METKNNPIDDLQAIRIMMERSSKFLSLSGLSGVFAGCVALAGAAIAYFGILKAGGIKYNEYMRSLGELTTSEIRLKLLMIAAIVLVLALGGAWLFSVRKARLKNQSIWNKTTRQLLFHLFVPLFAGGIFSLLLIWHNNIHLVASATLIFYGLALVNAGKFTFGEIQYLGMFEILLGLLAGIFLHYGILFWSLGFGALHIVYGLVMYYKYDRT